MLEGVSDEFDAAQVDPQKWNSNPGSWGAWGWNEANAAQESGKLKLRMTHEPHSRNNVNYFYKSGIVRSHQQMTYGYYEARIKACQLFPGACPAFWSYSDGRKYQGEVRYCEIDFVELQMNQMNQMDKQTGKRDPVEHIEMNLHLRLADKDGKVNWVQPPTHPELCASS
ncbi:MAG: beta-glucanase (GH16 family) [Verrucomicrobiales bacterium]